MHRQIGVNLTLFSDWRWLKGLRDIGGLKRAVGSFSAMASFAAPHHPDPDKAGRFTRQYMHAMATKKARVPDGMRSALVGAISAAITSAMGGNVAPTVRVSSRGTVRVTLRRRCAECGRTFTVKHRGTKRCARCRG